MRSNVYEMNTNVTYGWKLHNITLKKIYRINIDRKRASVQECKYVIAHSLLLLLTCYR